MGLARSTPPNNSASADRLVPELEALRRYGFRPLYDARGAFEGIGRRLADGSSAFLIDETGAPPMGAHRTLRLAFTAPDLRCFVRVLHPATLMDAGVAAAGEAERQEAEMERRYGRRALGAALMRTVDRRLETPLPQGPGRTPELLARAARVLHEAAARVTGPGLPAGTRGVLHQARALAATISKDMTGRGRSALEPTKAARVLPAVGVALDIVRVVLERHSEAPALSALERQHLISLSISARRLSDACAAA